MHLIHHFRSLSLGGLILLSVASGFAQESPAKTKALVVNGKTADSGVVQLNGRSYVDIETLAQVTNGTVTVEPSRIVLTFPLQAASATSPAASAAVPSNALSKDFSSAAIAALADMREWRGALSTMVSYGLAINASGVTEYRDHVNEDISQAAVVASTDADRNALALLRGEFDKLNSWANEILTARQNLNAAKTVDPNALKNDPELAKINDCGRFLNGMIVSGTFSDNGTCH
jgi:hypothetical protein